VTLAWIQPCTGQKQARLLPASRHEGMAPPECP
jgi:hypothetical protein